MKKIFLCVCFLTWATLAMAQVRLTAKTDKTDLALDDELTLTVQVSGISGTMVMPQLPSLPAFNVFSRETAQSITNGHTTLSFRYIMIPRMVGRTTIGPVTFKYGGKVYQTEPINIRIYRSAVPASAQTQRQPAKTAGTQQAAQADASAQMPPLERELAAQAYNHREPYFLVSAVSNKTPYVGQSFTLAVRFYYADGFYEAAYSNPTVSNLFMEDNGRSQGRQTLHGTVYNYEEKRYTLSGAGAGPASVGEASVTYRVESLGNSLFDRFFGGAVVSKPVTVTSQPISLSVRALPPGQPASFYGAVGSGFTMTAQLDKSETEAGDAVTLAVMVKGPGNLKTTSDLVFPSFLGFTSYPSVPQSGVLQNDSTRSYKLFQTVLVPQASGTYTLEGISWSYFDPTAKVYKTLTARPLSLKVLPSANPERKLDFGSQTPLGNGIETLQQDIRYLKTDTDTSLSLLARLPEWKWLHALVFMWLAVCLFMACIGKKTAAKKHAYQHAKTQLKKAKTYEHISDALSGYIRNKWNISTASLPLKDIVTALQKRGVSADSLRTFATLWKELESVRFAPVAPTDTALSAFVTRAAQLLKTWEKHV